MTNEQKVVELFNKLSNQESEKVSLEISGTLGRVIIHFGEYSEELLSWTTASEGIKVLTDYLNIVS